MKDTPLSSLATGEDLHMDFNLYSGSWYLVVVDHYSGFVWAEKMGSMSGYTVTEKVISVI